MPKEPLDFAQKKIKKQTQEYVKEVHEGLMNEENLHQKLIDCYGAEEYQAVLHMKAGNTDSSCSGIQEYLVDRMYQSLEKIEGISNIFEFTKELIRKLIFPEKTSVGECLTTSPTLIAKFKKFCQPLTENLSSHEKKMLQKALDLFMEEYRLGSLSLRGYWQEPTTHKIYDFEAFLDEMAHKMEEKFKKSNLRVVPKREEAVEEEDAPVSEMSKSIALASLLRPDSEEGVPLGIGCLATFFSQLLCETFHHLQSRCNVFQLVLKLFPEISKKTRFQNLFPMRNDKNAEEEKKLLEIKEYFSKNHASCCSLIETFWLEEKHQNLYSFAEFILQTARFVKKELKEKHDLSESTDDKSEQFLVTTRLNLGSRIAQAMIMWNIDCNIFELTLILFPALSKLANISLKKSPSYFNNEKKLQISAKRVKNYLEAKEKEVLESVNEICKKGYNQHLLQKFIEQVVITAKVIMDGGRTRLKFDENRKVEMPAMFGATLRD